jgi:tetratricopeptide (TPR) repeat protein
VYIGLATLLAFREQAASRLEVVETAIALARHTHDDVLLGHALLHQGDRLHKVGLSEQALVVVHEAMQIAESRADVALLAPSLQSLLWLHVQRGELVKASECVARYLAIVLEVEDPGLIARALWDRATLELDPGHWDQADQDLARMERLAPALARDPFTACLRAKIFIARGDWTEAAALLADAMAAVAISGNVMPQTWAERLLVELDLLEKDPGAALERLKMMLEQEQLKAAAHVLPHLALAHLQLAAVAEAQSVVDDAVKRATTEGNRLTFVDALRVQALLVSARRPAPRRRSKPCWV